MSIDMQNGVFVTTHGLMLDAVIGQVRAAAQAGVSAAWLPQVFGNDALTTLAVTGREVPGIKLGTAVIPTYPRHPLMLASQALTAQSATGGRLTLSVGPSHRAVIEGAYGYSYDRPIRHVREYIAALAPLLRGETVEYRGETLSAVGTVNVPGATPPSLMLAALGPAMLRLAGEMTDGTVTLFTGPRTIANHVVPTITRAADQAGRRTPRIVVGLAVCVSDEVQARRELLGSIYTAVGTGSEPSYQAMLEREGVATTVDVAIIGDEKTVEHKLRQYADAGATEFMATLFGTDEENTRTLELIASFG
ncbi:TIGR03564 family F420-dependent LLM class oxidoreductase [Streptomyces griseorubiginosus]|uniref:TIGR03564 family F420-dependent LLM class oxidoreductase n=1 Tax=Streptomyces griseorubiginosus TaxID=67304 RepID=UPI00365EAD95